MEWITQNDRDHNLDCVRAENQVRNNGLSGVYLLESDNAKVSEVFR